MRLLLAFSLLLTSAEASDRPIASPHVAGPGDLSGWTLNYNIPGQGPLPMTLVLARKGHIVRRIKGDPFVWIWQFQAGGRQVAYESGPLHFGMECILVEIASGKQLDSVDCFKPLPADAPDWARSLENRDAH